MKPEAVKTMWVTVREAKDKDHVIDYLIPNFDYELYCEDGKEQKLILYTKLKKELEGKIDVGILITDDPTPSTAIGWISLGYFHQRTGLMNCEQVKEEPATFVGKVKDLQESWGSALR